MGGTTEREERKGKKGKVKGGHIDRSPTFDYGNKGKWDKGKTSKGKTGKGKTDSNGEMDGKTDGKGIGSIQQSPCKVGSWGSGSIGILANYGF